MNEEKYIPTNNHKTYCSVNYGISEARRRKCNCNCHQAPELYGKSAAELDIDQRHVDNIRFNRAVSEERSDESSATEWEAREKAGEAPFDKPSNLSQVLEEFEKELAEFQKGDDAIAFTKDFIRTQFTALLEKMRMEENHRPSFGGVLDWDIGYNSAVQENNKRIERMKE